MPASAERAVAAPRTTACPHCGTLVRSTTAPGVEVFCCGGCEAANAIIRGAGLERYYQTRTEVAPRPRPRGDRWDQVEPLQHADGSCEVRFAIDGLRCASCVWVSEKVLQRTEGVLDATVSYATGRATVRWDPGKASLPEIATRIAALGYRPMQADRSTPPDRDLMVRLGVAAFAASNVMMLSAALYAGWMGPMEERFITLFQWFSLALATPVALWSAAPFFDGAWSGLRAGVLHMDVPIALAIGVLYGQGLVGTFLGVDTYLDSMTMLVTLLLAGRLIEAGGRRRAAEAAVTLAATVPATARRIAGTSVETVASKSLQIGDRIAVGTGEDVPADGFVRSGEGSLQRALLTGESEPVDVGVGDEVWAGTVLVDGSLVVEVSVEAEATVVEKMADELRRAVDRGGRPGSVDRIAPWFTAATLLVAGATFVAWFLVSGTADALSATVAVLVVACPCALALAAPLTGAAGLGAAARRGLLVRSPDALDRLATVDRMALDKTGTVTEGAVAILDASDFDLERAAALERFSRHPVAVAIVDEAIRRGIALPMADGVRETSGVGITGWIDGARWSLGRGIGGSLLVRDDAGYVGSIRYGDRIRPGASRSIERLRRLGVTPVLLSGDDPERTARVAEVLGGVEWRASLSPAEKARALQVWAAEGGSVLFAGDGLNDGLALAAADVGVAMGTGAASSILVADAVVGLPTIHPLASGVVVGRVCRAATRRSQVRSIAYNVLAVSAAAVGLVNPLVAAVLMPLSSAMVLAGAARVESLVRRAEVA